MIFLYTMLLALSVSLFVAGVGHLRMSTEAAPLDDIHPELAAKRQHIDWLIGWICVGASAVLCLCFVVSVLLLASR